MKKVISLLAVFLIAMSVFAQNPGATGPAGPAGVTGAQGITGATGNVAAPRPLKAPTEILLVFMPLILFGVMFISVALWLYNSDYGLSDALSNDDYRYKSEWLYSTTTDKLVEVSRTAEISPSSSRVIAFITGLATVSFAATMVSFFYYAQLTDLKNYSVGLDGLWKVLAAMGIGIIPYAAKTIKGDSPDKPDTPTGAPKTLESVIGNNGNATSGAKAIADAAAAAKATADAAATAKATADAAAAAKAAAATAGANH